MDATSQHSNIMLPGDEDQKINGYYRYTDSTIQSLKDLPSRPKRSRKGILFLLEKAISNGDCKMEEYYSSALSINFFDIFDLLQEKMGERDVDSIIDYCDNKFRNKWLEYKISMGCWRLKILMDTHLKGLDIDKEKLSEGGMKIEWIEYPSFEESSVHCTTSPPNRPPPVPFVIKGFSRTSKYRGRKYWSKRSWKKEPLKWR